MTAGKWPEMILFDYGHTLLYEPDFDLLCGERAVFAHIMRNPHQVTPEEALEFGSRIFRETGRSREIGLEIHEWQAMRMKYEYLGLEFDLSYPELERIMWDHASAGACMPYVKEMLAYLRVHGIRSGVISNIGWSGRALKERISRLLPEHTFEFIIASSEYGFRKPDPLLFGLALRKAALPAEKVWYCGDSVRNDVCGAYEAGIFPVLIEDRSVENPFAAQNEACSVAFDYLAVSGWKEFVDCLEQMRESADCAGCL